MSSGPSDGLMMTRGPLHRFMQHRVRDVLWVCSLYDSFRVERDGQLKDLLFRDYRKFGISNAPGVRRVTSGREALEAVELEDFDMVITLDRVGDISAKVLGQEIKRAVRGMPVIMLATSTRTHPIASTDDEDDVPSIDKVFTWSGDSRLFFTIVKYVEDLLNAKTDVIQGGTLALLLAESSVSCYSKVLPYIYFELIERNRMVAREGRNLTERAMKRRARPKLLLAQTREEAESYLDEYGEHLLGIVSSLPLISNGTNDLQGGANLIRTARSRDPDLPVLAICRRNEEWDLSEELAVRRTRWDDGQLREGVKRYFVEDLAFSDFVFRRPDGTEVERADNIRALVRKIGFIDNESLEYHAEHNHFSRWLRAHAEFRLAAAMRARSRGEFDSTPKLRAFLVDSLRSYVEEQRRGTVWEFDPKDFDPMTPIVQLSSGSLGAKAQGLASMSSLLTHYGATHRFEGVRIDIPPTAVIGTDTFDAFMENNDLWDYIEKDPTDEQLIRKFNRALVPSSLLSNLEVYLEAVHCPLAVRSSSLFEDSMELPLAGVYQTYMLPNNHPDIRVRLSRLMEAIKRVYASTFFYDSRTYLQSTPLQIRDEKMAIIIQHVVGNHYEDYFYPSVSGVVKSYNYYPFAPMRAEDGICQVGLGLGKWIVDGGKCVQFSPVKPTVIPHMSTTQDILKNSQREFFGLKMKDPGDPPLWDENENLVKLDLTESRESGALRHVGSIYSHDNDMIYTGVMRDGTPLVTFSQMLKSETFPLSKILRYLTEIGSRAMSSPVEIEFAVSLDVPEGKPKEFGFLQIRPMTATNMDESVDLEEVDLNNAIVVSSKALGHGVIENLYDIVYVPSGPLDRARTRDVAREIEHCNQALLDERTPYVLIGPGRWGTADRWLGIPVRWSQISGARLIVETQFEDIATEASQGSHFFHNLTAFQVGYLTVVPNKDSDIDYRWLESQPLIWEGEFVRRVKTRIPLDIRIDGKKGSGVILEGTEMPPDDHGQLL